MVIIIASLSITESGSGTWCNSIEFRNQNDNDNESKKEREYANVLNCNLTMMILIFGLISWNWGPILLPANEQLLLPLIIGVQDGYTF